METTDYIVASAVMDGSQPLWPNSAMKKHIRLQWYASELSLGSVCDTQEIQWGMGSDWMVVAGTRHASEIGPPYGLHADVDAESTGMVG